MATYRLTLCRCAVVAGLALHVNSGVDVAKWAHWQSFHHIKLRDAKVLTLGHADTSAPAGGRTDDARKVNVIAAKDSRI